MTAIFGCSMTSWHWRMDEVTMMLSTLLWLIFSKAVDRADQDAARAFFVERLGRFAQAAGRVDHVVDKHGIQVLDLAHELERLGFAGGCPSLVDPGDGVGCAQHVGQG